MKSRGTNKEEGQSRKKTDWGVGGWVFVKGGQLVSRQIFDNYSRSGREGKAQTRAHLETTERGRQKGVQGETRMHHGWGDRNVRRQSASKLKRKVVLEENEEKKIKAPNQG